MNFILINISELAEEISKDAIIHNKKIEIEIKEKMISQKIFSSPAEEVALKSDLLEHYKSALLLLSGEELDVNIIKRKFNLAKEIEDAEVRRYSEKNEKFASGQVKMIIKTYDGNLSGKGEFFYECGNVRAIADFNRNKLCGDVKIFSNDGILIFDGKYFDGMPVSWEIFFSDGVKICELKPESEKTKITIYCGDFFISGFFRLQKGVLHGKKRFVIKLLCSFSFLKMVYQQRHDGSRLSEVSRYLSEFKFPGSECCPLFT